LRLNKDKVGKKKKEEADRQECLSYIKS
jgi:hypothetical protein